MITVNKRRNSMRITATLDMINTMTGETWSEDVIYDTSRGDKMPAILETEISKVKLHFATYYVNGKNIELGLMTASSDFPKDIDDYRRIVNAQVVDDSVQSAIQEEYKDFVQHITISWHDGQSPEQIVAQMQEQENSETIRSR